MTLKQNIRLRPALPSDLDLLRHWDQQQHVKDSDPDSDWEWDVELHRNPEWREQFVAELNGRPIGFVQIIDPHLEEDHYWGDYLSDVQTSLDGDCALNNNNKLRAIDVWIGEADDLGQGFGTEMMQQAINFCFADPSVTAILIDPLETNVRAQQFYQRLGFQFEKVWQFDTDICRVFRLTRSVWLDCV